MTLLVERTVLPERLDWLEPEAERVASEVLRAVLPVLRLVRLFWSTLPVERVVEEEEPVERLVVAVPEELRLVELEVELPVLRPVRSF